MNQNRGYTMKPLSLFFFFLFFFVTSSSSQRLLNNKEDPFKSRACADAELYCKEANRAVMEEPRLIKYLLETRKAAKVLGNWSEAVGDHESMKLAEVLAIGCCLSFGECAKDDVRLSSPSPSSSSSSWSDENENDEENDDDDDDDDDLNGPLMLKKFAAKMFERVGNDDEMAKRTPEITFLAANVHVCAGPSEKSSSKIERSFCSSKRVKMFTRAARRGFNSAALTAAEILITRFGGEFTDKNGSCGRVSSISSNDNNIIEFPDAYDPTDAVVAKSLLKPLLATNDLDRKAKMRLKELEKIEEYLIMKGKQEPDVAMEFASYVVDLGIRIATILFLIILPAYLFRETKIISSVLQFVAKITGIYYVRRFFMFLRGDFEVDKQPRVNAGRAGKRADIRKKAKQIAKEMYHHSGEQKKE